MEVVEEPTAAPAARRSPRSARLAARSRAARAVTLSRDQEYAYIEGDLRRLLVISGFLLVLMLVLLLTLGR